MTKFAAAFAFFVLIGLTACTEEPANDVAAIEVVNDAAGELDAAFEAQDAEKVRALMTDDHLSVTPYYGAPQSVEDVLASLPDLKYEQSDVSEPTVTMLGSDAAMRTLTARIGGTYKEQAFSDKVFITSILTKQDGKWLERFYQATRVAP